MLFDAEQDSSPVNADTIPYRPELRHLTLVTVCAKRLLRHPRVGAIFGLVSSCFCWGLIQAHASGLYIGLCSPYRLGSMISQLVHPMPGNACGIGTLAGRVCSERAPVDINVHTVLIYQHSCMHIHTDAHTVQMHTSSMPIYIWILSCVTSHSRSGVPFFRQHARFMASSWKQRIQPLLVTKTRDEKQPAMGRF